MARAERLPPPEPAAAAGDGGGRRAVLRRSARGRRAVTDRTSAASLPDEAPVGALPLRSAVRNALRSGGVQTLGDLRAMGDRELLALRRFGPKALADVRFL